MAKCKECNKEVNKEKVDTRYVTIRLYETAQIHVDRRAAAYSTDKGNILVCYDCWKEISPSQYHIKEEQKYDEDKFYTSSTRMVKTEDLEELLDDIENSIKAII